MASPLNTNTSKAMATSIQNSLSTVASLAGSAMLARSVVNDLVPSQLKDLIYTRLELLQWPFSSSELTLIINEMDGYMNNLLYNAATTYLSTRIPASVSRIQVSQHQEGETLKLSVEQGEEIVDVFEGVEFKWQMICRTQQRNNGDDDAETKLFELSLKKKHKDKVFDAYLPYVLEQARIVKNRERTLQLFMNDGDFWYPINLRHPSTFETIAMDPEVKLMVMDDLVRFTKRKEYYNRIGKAWKRGYLLYGPPGTGKSSLIGAMANFLRFDIYDLELSTINSNSSLRRVLKNTPNRSILVVEDIDCAIDLQSRGDKDQAKPNNPLDDDKITLSGLLNFVDGLWSTSGEERLIVFTTNYKDRLDPALLRPGRMDMHIHMGYCSSQGFRTLAHNYHLLKDHQLFREIEGLLGEVKVTPAEVAEELMRSDDGDVALGKLVELLKKKKKNKDMPAPRDEQELNNQGYFDGDQGKSNEGQIQEDSGRN